MNATIRIAMWSGPRNISTAMMRSFENRSDCVVVDEPFYAAFLAKTGLDHPMREEVLASQPQDGAAVARDLVTREAPPARIFYQKHMTQHMIPSLPRDWLDGVRSAFLIRDPASVLASYAKKHDGASLDAIGLATQVELFAREADRLGHAPPVVEGRDVLAEPKAMLTKLCAALGIAFDPAMLAWPPGPRDSDGVWAPAWYDAVHRSTGFGPPPEPVDPARLPDALRRIADEARPLYERLRAHRL